MADEKLVDQKVKSTDIDTELAGIEQGWLEGKYVAVAMVAITKDRGAHLVVIPGECNRLELMGAVADLVLKVNEQKI